MWAEIEKEFLGDSTGRSQAFFDTVLDLTDYYQQASARNKEEINLEADKNEWLRRVKEDSRLSDEEREKLSKYIINSIDNLGGGNQKMTDEQTKNEIPTVDEIIDVATKKPTLTMKSGFSPHDLRDVSWGEVHRMTAQKQFRFDEIVKAQKPSVRDGVLSKDYQPDKIYESPRAYVERKPGGFEMVETTTGGKREVYPTPEQAVRAARALEKETSLREKEEALELRGDTVDELVNLKETKDSLDEAITAIKNSEDPETDSIYVELYKQRDRIEKLIEEKRIKRPPTEKPIKEKATLPSVGRGTRQRSGASIGEAGRDRKANPVRLG